MTTNVGSHRGGEVAPRSPQMNDRVMVPLPKRAKILESETVGLADRTFSAQRRRMLDLINQLHNSGVQADIDLPQIAVIGSQSAGKSSLIESISGITLPRASGTCTRCPMECRLSSQGDIWQCKISLLLHADSSTKKKSRNIQFGEPLFSKDGVEDRLRRAQLAILNPDVEPLSFLTGAVQPLSESKTALSFSTNCVCIEISGPDVADLSFVDLPGIIATVRDGNDSGDIEKVKSLVTSYIERPNTVILLTVSCENDFENQGASQLAREQNPDGSRMIGVLTKPDRIEKGEEGRWLGFIRNTDQSLRHGWFCVKNPSPAELKEKPTWDEVRSRETEFFTTQSPWSSLEYIFTQKLGTHNLMETVSNILSDLIAARLPEIEEETEKLLRETELRLLGLPPPMSSDPVSQLWKLVIDFDQDINREVEGTSKEDGLIQKIRASQATFRQTIYAYAPRFRPFKNQGRDQGTAMPKVTFLGEDGELLPKLERGRVMYLDEVAQRAEKAVSRELPDNYPYVVKRDLIREYTATWNTPAMELFSAVEQYVSETTRTLIGKHFGAHVHGGLVDKVQSIVRQQLQEHKAIAVKGIEKLLRQESAPYTINTHYLADYKDKWTSYLRDARAAHESSSRTAGFRTTLATPESQSTFGNQTTAHKQATSNSSPVATKAPPAPSISSFGRPVSATSPIASNATVTGLSSASTFGVAQPVFQLTSSGLSHVASTGLTGSADDDKVSAAIQALAAIGYEGLKRADLARLHAPDPSDPIIEIMAEVRAYYQVAFKRFADNVPLAIDWDYVRAFSACVRDALVKQLGLSAPDVRDRCMALLEERPDLARLRAEMDARRERLIQATNALKDMRV